MLGEEITDLMEMLSAPPEELVNPIKEMKLQCKQTERELEKLATQISEAKKSDVFRR